MLNTLLGFKKEMTSGYDARGRRVGVTIVEIKPNYVAQIKTVEKDGYSAVQLGSGTAKSVRKPQIEHLKKLGVDKSIRHIREIRVEEVDVTSGQELSVKDVFSKGDAVKVTGVSKGKGFQGGVRRWGFHGGPKTHGQSDRHRAPGSIGSGTTPGRVFKGKKMAGHMGMDGASFTNLEVINVDRQNNLLTIKGGLPGTVGSLLIIQNIGKIKGYIAPPEEKPDDEEEVKVEGAEETAAEAETNENTENVAVAESKTEEVAEPETVEGSPVASAEEDKEPEDAKS